MDSIRNKDKEKNIAVVGAGAAGLTAAYFAVCRGNRVTVYDKNDIPGKKLRLTGNGRCNFTNADLSPSHYEHYSDRAAADVTDSMSLEYDLQKITAVLEKNGKEEYVSFLNACGIPSFEKNGYYYPLMERAGELCDILVKILRRKGVNFCLGENIREVGKTSEGIFVLNGENYDALILACGGKAAPATGSDGGGFKLARSLGHTVSFTYPVLVPLISDEALLSKVAGVRLKAQATAFVDGERISKNYGEIQFTDHTISGIPVFQLSRHLTKAVEENRCVEIVLDPLPEVREEEINSFIDNRRETLGDVAFEELFEGLLPKKYYDFLLSEFAKTENETLKTNESAFLNFMKSYPFPVSGHAGYENAQSTRGGVILSEMKDDLESSIVPNLYIIGEMLDVDGDCGGYNLQWAFSSGKLVGEEI